MNSVLAFAATLVTLRLAGELLRRYRHRPDERELLVWATALAAYSLAAAALAWGSAGGWSEAPFRLYYLGGALLTAPLLGLGSLTRLGVRRAPSIALAYAGVAVGIAVAMPVSGSFPGTDIPRAQDHLELFPARVVAIAANSLGTAAVVVAALATFRSRPLGNGLLLLGVVVAAVGSALVGLGAAGTAAFIAIGAALLYGGFVVPRRSGASRGQVSPATGARGP